MQLAGIYLERGEPLIHRTIFALALALTGLLIVAGCAPKRDFTATTIPAWDVVQTMPLAPPEGLSERQRRSFEEGWRSLQQGNLQRASGELEGLGRRYGRNAEISTAQGFVELRLGSWQAADRFFRAALREEPTFGPAQSGFFLTALATGDEEQAYERLVRLEVAFPAHELVDRYKTTLQVNVAETRLRDARALVEEGKHEEAAGAYLRALEVVPEVGGLYLEAAEVELAAGLTSRAVNHARRATELEPNNVTAFRVLGESLYAAEDLSGAFEAYREASLLSPQDTSLRERYQAIVAAYEEVNLPPEYLHISEAERLERQQLAALLYLGLRSLFEGAQESESQVIAMDIADSWAQNFIRRVLSVGILEVYPNHTFQPRAFVNRADLANGLAAALEFLSPQSYRAAKESSRFDQDFPDLSSENLNYEAAALSVSLGLLMARDGGGFDPQGLVSGPEAVSAVEALAAHMTR